MRRPPLMPLLVAMAGLVAGCRAPAAPAGPVQVTRPLMGTTFCVVVDAPDGPAVRAAIEAALDAASTVEAWASDWLATSEVRRVAERAEGLPAGTPVPVSEALGEHLGFALEVATRTEGAFDPTLGTLTRLWRRTARQGELPSDERLAQARALAGHGAVVLAPDRRALSFLSPGLRLDLGGSAKGEALDRALAVLSERGYPRAVIDGGGDLRLGDPPRGVTGWRVEVRPFGPTGPLLRFVAARCAVATSGDVEKRVEVGGVTFGHVLDPATGLGLTTPSAATVIAADGRTADALATALLVRGPGGCAALPSWGGPGVEGAVFTPADAESRARVLRPTCATPGFPEDGGLVAPHPPASHLR